MNRSYLTALTILAVLAILSFFILRVSQQAQEGKAAQINISGRQRMLSQRIALFSLQLADADDSLERANIKKELTRAILLMENSHQSLTKGDPSRNLPANLSEEVKRLFFSQPNDLDGKITIYIKEAKLLATESGPVAHDNEHLRYILNTARSDILTSIDRVVTQLQMESEELVNRLQILHLATTFAALLMITLVGLILFRPMVARIDRETIKLREAYRHQHRIADTLQRELVPEILPRIDGMELKVFFQSATKEAEVGGDFYDIFEISKGLWGIAVGDVAGNGIDAATETARVKYLLRDRAYSGDTPDKVLSRINEALLKQKPERFTALIYCIYDLKTSSLLLANAGNPYPYLLREDRFLSDTSLLLSIEHKQRYPLYRLDFQKDDLIIMYTDGLIEVRRDSEEFGEERVREFVRANNDLPLNGILEGLIEEARRFSNNNLTDDILIMGLRKTE